jgi:hypothetical protein
MMGDMKIHRVGRIGNDLDQVDLYLWFNEENFINMIWGEVHEEYHQERRRFAQRLPRAFPYFT